MNFLNRLPKVQDIYPVFGLITFLIYAWGLYAFAWILPSWLNFLSLQEIAGILSYTFVVNFLESITLLCSLLFLGVLLPRIFRFDFIFRASLSALWVACLYSFLMLAKIPYYRLWAVLLIWMLMMPFIHYYLGRNQTARAIIISLTERAIIFNYVCIPLTILSFINLIFRNF